MVKIAAPFTLIQPEGRAADWFERYRRIGAVIMPDVNRAAARAFGDGSLHTTVAGKPLRS